MLLHRGLIVQRSVVCGRLFSTSRALLAPGDLANAAAQKERVQSRDAIRKAELRKMTRLRAKARASPQKSPLYKELPDALRYLRAAEVGRPPSHSVITICSRIVNERGAPPLAGSVTFSKPLKEPKVILFTSDEALTNDAKEAGVTLIGGEQLISDIQEGKIPLEIYDRAFASPEIVSRLNSIARMLGPKGLMPSAKRGTITTDVKETLKSVAGSLPFKQKGENLSISVGRVSFSDKEIIANVIEASKALRVAVSTQKAKKQSIVGETCITSTNGPGIVISLGN